MLLIVSFDKPIALTVKAIEYLLAILRLNKYDGIPFSIEIKLLSFCVEHKERKPVNYYKINN